MLLDPYVSDKPVIVYDTNEARTHVIRYLKKYEDITVVKRPLEIADYLVQTAEGTIAVERKRASDFLSSISDGRLFTQLENLLEYEDPRLILEGAVFTNCKGGRCLTIDSVGKSLHKKKSARSQPRTVWSTQFWVHPHAFTSIYKKVQDMGIRIVPTGSVHDTADILHFWATQGERGEHLSIRLKPKTFTDLDKQLYLIAGIPGVNTKRAEALLKEFGTPMAVFNSFMEYPAKRYPVGGIGGKTVGEIRRILTKNIVEGAPRRMIEHEFKSGVAELLAILHQKENELKGMTIPQLKEELRKRGLKLGGRKGELVERLLETIPEDERVDIPLFMEKFEELEKSKTEFQAIPRKLRSAYRRFKKGAKK